MSCLNRKYWVTSIASMALCALVGCGGVDLPGPVANAESARTIRDAMKAGGESGATDAAAVSTGTGWATLRGRFVFGGTPPQRQPYNVTRDAHFCTEGGRPPLQETLVVQDGSNGIKNVAVYLRRASRVHESLQTDAAPLALDQKTCVFLPHLFLAQVGREVHFKNSDPEGHNTKFGSFNEIIPNGATKVYTHTTELAMPIQVSCSIHPWMTAWFLARSNPYAVSTNDDGTFELANLPAGEELEFQVWHESASGTSGLVIPPTPETKALNWSTRGRFKIKLNPDEVKEIQLTVPPSAFKGV